MIFLTNEHVEQVLDMASCMEVIERAYRELAMERATYRPRIDLYVPQEPHYYRWGTMEGASRERGVMAIRMKSDMLAWTREGVVNVEDKYCIEPGTYCGLIFLCSVRDARPLALINDGYLQHIRVGACAGIAAKYLARSNASVLAVIGSGGMARAYASAIARARTLTEIRVFSPTVENRLRFAREVEHELEVPVVAVAKPEDAVRGSDIVALCTDSLIPVIDAKWLEPGMHVTNVRGNEASPDVLRRADVLARLGTSTLPREGIEKDTICGTDGMTAYIAGSAEEAARIPGAPLKEIDNPDIGTVPDLMAGRWAGRTSDEQITFLNNQGTQGLQFAAVGGLVHERAIAAGLGHPLPDEWFVQNIRD